MNRLNKIFFGMAVMLSAGLAGCTDEIEYLKSGDEQPRGYYLTIPDVSAEATRALEGGDPADPASIATLEGKLTDLWLVVYDANNGSYQDSKNILDELSPVEFHNGATGSKTYDLTDWFEGLEGTYNLYLLANLDKYTTSQPWKTGGNESDLKNIPIVFRSGTTTTYGLDSRQVATNGLPMACLNSEVQVTVSGETQTGKGLKIVKGGNASIHADLKFLCSKIRYTILFDNTSGTTPGFSKAVFGDKTLSFSGATATQLNGGAQTIGADSKSSTDFFDLTKIHLNGVDYPANGVSYPSANYSGVDQRFTNLSRISGNPTGNQRAWQGVVYVPANPSTEKPTGLSFTGKVDGTTGTEVAYTLPLLPQAITQDGSSSAILKAGKYYDIVAKASSLETLKLQSVEVIEWNKTQLAYTLMQNLYLHVDKERIAKVEAGKQYAIWVDSSGELGFKSSKFTPAGGKEMDVFDHEFVGDSLYVSINSDIDASMFEQVSDNADIRWFEILAGGGIIHKKIDVGEIDLHRFLNVSPATMFINVNELTSSGWYNNPEAEPGEKQPTEFEVETNVDSFWVEIANWPGTTNVATNHIWIEDEDGNKIDFNAAGAANIKTLDNREGVRKFLLRYEGLNSGYALWASDNSLRLNFRVDNTGFSGNNYVNPRAFRVEIAASKDNYIIHFKSKDNKLGTPPHLYIYQCLETPSTYKYTYQNTKLTNYPVGIGTGSTSAALEYSFTGKVAFKGWDWDMNATTLATNDISGWGKDNSGFICFNGDWDEKTSDRYNRDMDFYKVYRSDASRCKCADCRGDNYNAGWPGLVMEEEGDGWYKLELTGIAEAGRSLLIWTNMHQSGDGKRQYPIGSGIRLFDYPSKEAWFYFEGDYYGYNDNSGWHEGWNNTEKARWYVSKAAAEAAAGGGTITDFDFSSSNGWIYFTNPDKWANVYIHYWGGSSESAWPGKQMTKMTVDGKQVWGYQVPTNTTGIIFNNGSGTQTGDIDIDNSTNYYNKTGKEDTALSDGVATDPEEGDYWPLGTYRIYFSTNNKPLWLWTVNGSTDVESGKEFNGGTDFPSSEGTWDATEGMAYKEYTLTKNAKTIKWIYDGKSGENNDAKIKSLDYSPSTAPTKVGNYYKLVISN